MPTRESLQAYKIPDWFRDAKFGIWAHWGPQSAIEDGDWYARNMYVQGQPQYLYHCETYGHPSKVGYKDLVNIWKAEKWDPDHLMGLYKKAGAKYFFSDGRAPRQLRPVELEVPRAGTQSTWDRRRTWWACGKKLRAITACASA